MASSLVTPPVVKARALNCPNCGAAVALRGFGHTLTVVCPNCLTTLDTSEPEIKILGQIQEAQRCDLKIPLGTRGKLAGAEWEAIGFQQRMAVEDSDSWDEYLLFNPYKGFRYLTEYQGHWNFVTPLEPMPERLALGGRPAVSFEGKHYKHFSGCEAMTSFVLGEFPWRVQVGEKVICDDFIHPPFVLSSETTRDEITWSRGEYTPADAIWQAFSLPGKPERPRGIYLNQPSPYEGKGSMWPACLLMLLLLAGLAMFFAVFSRENVVFRNSYYFSTLQPEPSFVTPVFNIDGRASGLQLIVHADVNNNWAYFNFALINDDTGSAYDFGREVSYYHGTDSDGSWTEGGQTSTAYLPSVPPGRYYLRVEPEMDAAGPYRNGTKKYNAVAYDITIRHDVPNYAWFWIAGILLLIPPAISSLRRRSFEKQRWAQSSGPVKSSSMLMSAVGSAIESIGE
ncbi:MAG TPA: DUF4178 domain-containing protein [Bryobacteraceae bacterium]|jgi:hypothetical protein|nr:DUF4178 domain-containing protein [Bryobacteraceae bacterium]